MAGSASLVEMGLRLLNALLFLGLFAAPDVARACPSCVGNDRNPEARLWMLAGFTLLPFLLFAGVAVLVYRLSRDETRRSKQKRDVAKG